MQYSPALGPAGQGRVAGCPKGEVACRCCFLGLGRAGTRVADRIPTERAAGLTSPPGGISFGVGIGGG